MMPLSDLDKTLEPLLDGPEPSTKLPTYRQCFLSILGNGKAATADEARAAARIIIKLQAGGNLDLPADDLHVLKKRVALNDRAFITWTHGQLLLYLDAY